MRRLDIDPEAVKCVPTEPREILTRCFGSGPKFPRERVLAFAAASPASVCQTFVNSLRQIKSKDLDQLSFEAMCVYAQVNPLELLGGILMSAKSMKATESALKAIMAHPDVVQTTIDSAKTPLGFSDRQTLHQALGFLPQKQGQAFNFNFGSGRPEEDRDEDSDADEAWDEAFPPLGEKIQEWSTNKHKILEAGK